ncbi:hypothetical protein [Nocardia sp. NPDC059239]|uniref:hypothetical protein n=1 Tax=unclassified Nocardia TaxID=2637762 RepID=UPI0036AD4570
MAEIITATDLPASVVKAVEANTLAVMVAGANARATRVAPCLGQSPTADQLAEAKLVLIGAIQRWSQAGAGAYTATAAGPFSVGVDTRQRSGYTLWPSEITQLQDICANPDSSKAYSIDTVSVAGPTHADTCALTFAANYCDCGADLTGGLPLYE